MKKSFSGRSRSTRRADGIVAALILASAVFSALVAFEALASAGEVRSGVEVGGVEVGGLSREEAKAKIEAEAIEPLRSIELSGAAGSSSLSAGRLGLSFDAEAAASEAYAVGREGGIPERLADRLRAAFGMAGIPVGTGYEPDLARAAVSALEEEVNAAPRDASVEVRGERVAVREARPGYRLDVEATLKNVEAAVAGATGEAELVGETLEPAVPTGRAEQAAGEAREAISGGLTLTAGESSWSVAPAEVGRALVFEPDGEDLRVELDRERLRGSLSEVRAALTVEPVEAGYVAAGPEKVSVTPGKSGRGVREERLLERMEAGIFGGERRFEVPLRTVEPELTTEEAERLKPTTLLGEYATDYTWDADPGRRTNMSLASEALDGTYVAPGEVFSFNAVTSPIDYEPAKVIVEGATEYADGGGVSQVSSTLYMAANLAGLEIVEAHPHSAELPYIRPGLDTTVWFGALDLRFRNNTPGYLFIRQWQGEDGFNHATIHGVPTGREVSVSSEKVYDGVDASGEPVTRWEMYRTVTREGGEVVEDGVFRTVTYRELEPYEGPPPGGTPEN